MSKEPDSLTQEGFLAACTLLDIVLLPGEAAMNWGAIVLASRGGGGGGWRVKRPAGREGRGEIIGS